MPDSGNQNMNKVHQYLKSYSTQSIVYLTDASLFKIYQNYHWITETCKSIILEWCWVRTPYIQELKTK